MSKNPEANELESATRRYTSYDRGVTTLPPGGLDPGYDRRFFTGQKKELERNKEIQAAKDLKEQVGQDIQVSIPVSEKDVQIAHRREIEADIYGFETWLTSIFDPKDPNLARLIKEWYPEYFEKRLEVMDKKLEMQKRLARLKVLGPQDRDDLWLAYNIEQGRVPMQSGPIWEATPDENRSITRGVLNPAGRINLYTFVRQQGVKSATWPGWTNQNSTISAWLGAQDLGDPGAIGMDYVMRYPGIYGTTRQTTLSNIAAQRGPRDF